MALSQAKPHDKDVLSLPVLLASPGDLGRLIRELENLEDQISQAGLRHKAHEPEVPKTSTIMAKTLELNKADLMNKDHRKLLHELLVNTKKTAPVVHMSFSTDPSPAFMEKMVAWLRHEIHPQVLVTIGLQPNLGVGCILRTTNKSFDLSLKQDFLTKRDLLLKAISVKPTASAPKKVVEVAT